MNKPKKYSASDENLLAHALEPAMRWLIATALDGSTMTYSEVQTRLETEANFSKVFPTRIGFVAGRLMRRILNVEPTAPLLNVLVVSQGDRQPSSGAGEFMADRFGVKRLGFDGAKDAHPRLWKRTYRRAAGEVYEVKSEDWSALFQRVFNKPLAGEAIKLDRSRRHDGTELDGVIAGRRYGAGGEGPFHKALRIWVRENPGSVHRSFADATTETEADLDSGDRVDVVYKFPGRTVVIEVKSRISNIVDLRRGVFQCIKYRAVREAMDVLDDPLVEAILITEMDLPGEIKKLAKLHSVRHIVVPLDRG